MQAVAQLLTPKRTACRVPGLSKKRLFETLARLISDDQGSIRYEDVFDRLIARERLGSTGLGEGIAIPHCRMQGLDKPVGALLTLGEPVDFDSPDNRPVDLVFALLVPEGEDQQHLDTLAGLAKLFNQEEYRARLRAAQDTVALYAAASRGADE